MPRTLRPDFAAHRRARDGTVATISGGPALAAAAASARSARRRRRTERRREREERSRLVLSHATAFVTFDATGAITDWNARCEQLFGWRAGEVIGRNLISLILAPEETTFQCTGLEHFLAAWDRPDTPRRLELTAISRDGDRFPVELSLFSLQVEGRPGFAAFVTDISERRRAESQLRHSDDVVRALLEDTSDIVIAKGVDLRIQVANRATATHLGLPVDHLVGRRLTEVLPAATAVSFEENDRTVIAYRRSLVFEEVLPTPRGDRSFLVTRHPYVNQRGDLAGLIMRGIDITERRARQRRHACAQRQLRERLHGFGVGVSIGTLGEAFMLDANERYLHFFGLRRDQMVGRNTAPMKVWTDERDRSGITTDLGRTGHAPLRHINFRRGDGSVAPGLFSIRLANYEDRLIWVAVLADARSSDVVRRELADVEQLVANLATFPGSGA